jgi:hypothetical protein
MKKPKLTIAKLFGHGKDTVNVTGLIFKNAGAKPAASSRPKPAAATRPGKKR